MKKLNLFTLVIFLCSLKSYAYIPSARMILDRVVENSLKVPLYIEQEMNLSSGQIHATLKEQWLFEGENNIKLIVKGEKDLQDQLLFHSIYSDNQRTTTLNGTVQTTHSGRPLFEKMLFISKPENLMRFLVQQEIVDDSIFQSQNFKKIPGNNGFQYQPELFLRLGRIGGGVAYIFGLPPKTEDSTAGFWVEQDLFNILKIRNSKGDEFRFEKPTTFSKGAKWPKELSYSWKQAGGSGQASVQVVQAKVATPALKQIFQKFSDKRGAELEQSPVKNLVDDFYLRFR